jgi:ABC-type antimicrobial peptide transport system permease subunit
MLGLLVLLLAAMGVYGVVALAVTTRIREFGLRIALGATRRVIVRDVFAGALRLALPGLVVGGLLAAGTAVAMQSMLLGLNPVDPVSVFSSGVVLLSVVFASSLGPALRASGIHPMEALRRE